MRGTFGCWKHKADNMQVVVKDAEHAEKFKATQITQHMYRQVKFTEGAQVADLCTRVGSQGLTPGCAEIVSSKFCQRPTRRCE